MEQPYTPPFIPKGTHYIYYREVHGVLKDILLSGKEAVVYTVEGGVFKIPYRGLSITKMRVYTRTARIMNILQYILVLVLILFMFYAFTSISISGIHTLMGIFFIFFIIMMILTLLVSICTLTNVLVVVDTNGKEYRFIIPKDRLKEVRDKLSMITI